uniref:Uncharacterized protein n=1 Tax=Arundo donax TaxID=35708 RepID=A0A0A8YTK3_ARUDO
MRKASTLHMLIQGCSTVADFLELLLCR